MHIVGKYIIHLHSLGNRTEKLTKGSLVYLFLKLIQIYFIFSDKVYILSIYYHFIALHIYSLLQITYFSCINNDNSCVYKGVWLPLQSNSSHSQFDFMLAKLLSVITFISSRCQRQCELLPSLGVRRLSSVNFSHFNLLLWNPLANFLQK
jgi:hypothetical protein